MKAKIILILTIFFFSLLFYNTPFVRANYFSPITPKDIFGIVLMFIIIYFLNNTIEFVINYNYLSSFYLKKSELLFSVMYINFITYPIAQALGSLLYIIMGFYFFIYYIIAEIIIIYCEWEYLFSKVKEKSPSVEKSIVFRSVLLANILSFIILLILSGFYPPIYLWL